MLRKRKISVLATILAVMLVCTATAFRAGWFGGKWTSNNPVEDEVGYFDFPGTQVLIDPWIELQKIIDRYYSRGQVFHYRGKMILYDDNDLKPKLIEQHDFSFSFLDDEFYYKLGFLEMVVKKNLQIVANNYDKTVLVKTDEIPPSRQPLGELHSLRALLEEKKAAVRITQIGSSKVITINEFPDAQVQAYQLWYDTATYAIRKISMGMVRLSPIDGSEMHLGLEEVEQFKERDSFEGYAYKVEVTFDQIERDKEKDFFPERRFIYRNGTDFSLVGTYQDFTLLR